MSEEDAAKAVRYYREYYTEKGIFENSVYDGFDESIKRLKEQVYLEKKKKLKKYLLVINLLNFLNKKKEIILDLFKEEMILI